jgi:hypothetical protein
MFAPVFAHFGAKRHEIGANTYTQNHEIRRIIFLERLAATRLKPITLVAKRSRDPQAGKYQNSQEWQGRQIEYGSQEKHFPCWCTICGITDAIQSIQFGFRRRIKEKELSFISVQENRPNHSPG